MEEETVKTQVLHKQARKIVFKVYNYYKNVNEQNAAGHLDAGNNIANVQETTAEACGVGLRTVQRILLVKERGLSYLVLKGRWCDIVVINAHAPTEEKDDHIKDSFYEELEHTFDHLPRYHMKVLLGDFNAKVGQEDIFKPTIGKESLHISSNDNGVRKPQFKSHGVSVHSKLVALRLSDRYGGERCGGVPPVAQLVKPKVSAHFGVCGYGGKIGSVSGGVPEFMFVKLLVLVIHGQCIKGPKNKVLRLVKFKRVNNHAMTVSTNRLDWLTKRVQTNAGLASSFHIGLIRGGKKILPNFLEPSSSEEVHPSIKGVAGCSEEAPANSSRVFSYSVSEKPEQASQPEFDSVCVRIFSIQRPEFECSGPQLEGPEFECSGPQLEGPEFEYSELSLKVCGSRYRELEFINCNDYIAYDNDSRMGPESSTKSYPEFALNVLREKASTISRPNIDYDDYCCHFEPLNRLFRSVLSTSLHSCSNGSQQVTLRQAIHPNFPECYLEVAVNSYTVLNKSVKDTTLSSIRNTCLRNIDGAVQLLRYIASNNSQDPFCEVTLSIEKSMMSKMEGLTPG
ncbi:hypothetical protein ANN_12373 [Periplaneta americana]|uniref:Uncharacterized protein n=1 Tax=Periplaneta americana TaxID=6978 RepID=A0ABQ8THD9_PERAM|nr:hypothetical protein ANN_12373 [Periplaneta americana]